MSRGGMRKDQCRRGTEGGLKATSRGMQKINKDKTHKNTLKSTLGRLFVKAGNSD